MFEVIGYTGFEEIVICDRSEYAGFWEGCDKIEWIISRCGHVSFNRRIHFVIVDNNHSHILRQNCGHESIKSEVFEIKTHFVRIT